MKLKDITIACLSILLVIACWLILSERQKKKFLQKANDRLTDENKKLKDAYLNLLEKNLIENEAPNDILKELEKLKTNFIELSDDIHAELNSIIKLVESGESVKAVKDLAKIVENMLREKAAKDDLKNSKLTFHKLLEYAKEKVWFNANEYAFASFIKHIRNKESHELNVQLESHTASLAIFSGIEIIYKLNQS